MSQGKRFTVLTSDSVELNGLLFEHSEPVGTVLLRTPYDAAAHLETALAWHRRGFNCLLQDVRGRYASAGEWVPYQHEAADGAESVAAIRASGWHRGVLILFGASYAGHCALEASRTLEIQGSPADAAIVLVPALGLHETAWHSDGTARLRERIGWWHEHGFGRCSSKPLSNGELDRLTALAEQRGVMTVANFWRLNSCQQDLWQRLWVTPKLALRRYFGAIATPLLLVSGEHDFFTESSAELARAWGSENESSSLTFLTGPWDHRLGQGIPTAALGATISAAGNPGKLIDAWTSAHFSSFRAPSSQADELARSLFADQPSRLLVTLQATRWVAEPLTYDGLAKAVKTPYLSEQNR